MDRGTNMNLVVLKYSKYGNLMYKTAMESDFCFDLVNRLSNFYKLGINSLMTARNLEVTIDYSHSEMDLTYDNVDYDYYDITIKDERYEEYCNSLTITCELMRSGGISALSHNDKSLRVVTYNEFGEQSFPHYYDLTESKKNKDFENICDTLLKLIESFKDNEQDIVNYFSTYRNAYASAYDCSVPEFIIDNDDDEILWQLDPLNKEIRYKIFREFM